MHTCDNPRCCNPDHLREGTQLDNIADRDRKGRQARNKGSQSGSTRLTPEEVREIRALYAEGGISQRQLSARYGVVQSAIHYIVTNKVWTDA